MALLNTTSVPWSWTTLTTLGYTIPELLPPSTTSVTPYTLASPLNCPQGYVSSLRTHNPPYSQPSPFPIPNSLPQTSTTSDHPTPTATPPSAASSAKSQTRASPPSHLPQPTLPSSSPSRAPSCRPTAALPQPWCFPDLSVAVLHPRRWWRARKSLVT